MLPLFNFYLFYHAGVSLNPDLNKTITLTSGLTSNLGSPDIVTSCDLRSESSETSQVRFFIFDNFIGFGRFCCQNAKKILGTCIFKGIFEDSLKN